MKKITLVTGNKHKLLEYQRLMPTSIPFGSVALDFAEIQSMDSAEIVLDKAKRAYEELGKPVLVEDVSAGLVSLNGLPGPFIKFYEQLLGMDALYQIAHGDDKRTTITCTIGYYDGQEIIIASGTVKGIVVPKRAPTGFGFDCVFMPEGHNKTFSEMGVAEKDILSHRALAVKDLARQLLQQ